MFDLAYRNSQISTCSFPSTHLKSIATGDTGSPFSVVKLLNSSCVVVACQFPRNFLTPAGIWRPRTFSKFSLDKSAIVRMNDPSLSQSGHFSE